MHKNAWPCSGSFHLPPYSSEDQEHTGPQVVELPVKRTHAKGPQATPVLYSRLNRKALLYLAQVDEIGKAIGHPEIACKHLRYFRIAARIALMVLHYGAVTLN